VLLIYWKVIRISTFIGGSSFFDPFEMIAVLVLCIGITDAYNVEYVCTWYHWKDIEDILFYIKFENGLHFSVLRNRATVYKNISRLKTKKVPKTWAFQSPLQAIKNDFFLSIDFLLLLCFFITFFFLPIDNSTAPQTTCPLHNSLKRRTQSSSLLLTILSYLD
jgi:hypothetical protein